MTNNLTLYTLAVATCTVFSQASYAQTIPLSLPACESPEVEKVFMASLPKSPYFLKNNVRVIDIVSVNNIWDVAKKQAMEEQGLAESALNPLAKEAFSGRCIYEIVTSAGVLLYDVKLGVARSGNWFVTFKETNENDFVAELKNLQQKTLTDFRDAIMNGQLPPRP